MPLYISKIEGEKYIHVTTSLDCTPPDATSVTIIRNLSAENVIATLKDGYPDWTIDVDV